RNGVKPHVTPERPASPEARHTSVPPGGIEPPTHGLGNRCSSPLSYGGGLPENVAENPSTRSATPRSSSVGGIGGRQPPERSSANRVAHGKAAGGRLRGDVWPLGHSRDRLLPRPYSGRA